MKITKDKSERLEDNFPPFEEYSSLEQLARQQGVVPVSDLDELVADFWPQEESGGGFIATLREWRDDK